MFRVNNKDCRTSSITLTECHFWLTLSKLMFAGIAITVRNSFLLGILEMLENIVINGSFNTKLFKRKDSDY